MNLEYIGSNHYMKIGVILVLTFEQFPSIYVIPIETIALNPTVSIPNVTASLLYHFTLSFEMSLYVYFIQRIKWYFNMNNICT